MNSKNANKDHFHEDESHHDEELLYEELDTPVSLDGIHIAWSAGNIGNAHDGTYPETLCDTKFDASVIYLNAACDSALRWDKEIALIQQTDKKYVVFLDCGLFDNLKLPLSHKQQFLSLGLAVNHYVETVAKPYQEKILGTILFAGDLFTEKALSHAAHQQNFEEWKKAYYPDHHQDLHSHNQEDLYTYFAIDHTFDFLHLMGNMLPRKQNAIVVVECIQTLSPALFCKMLLAAKRSNLILAVSNPPFMAGGGIFQAGTDFGFAIGTSFVPLHEKPSLTTAIVLQESDLARDATIINALVQSLKEKDISFRVISEESLVAEWEGIETIHIPQRLLEIPLIKRKLQGFIAAQGTVVPLLNQT